MSDDDLTFRDAPDASRFELRRGDELVSVLDYRIKDGEIALTRAFTPPPQRGQGLAAVITERAVDEIARRGGLRIQPVCSYVGVWFDAHPERADLLA
ncbi:GNAT family N-acetyltransferase [Microbacterium sp. gxy059]|uniref:GNAT family N-acetyltransferase n=1 Tax=Microbacterium sp. gxy059 TaxID=2957199 RepID=UPI003D96F6F5